MPEVRRIPAQQRSKDMVEYILEAAARVFDREGVAATTNRIADEAGVSIGSLYQYFADKHALLEALALRHLDEVERVFAAALDHDHETGQDVRALIERLVEAAVRVHAHQGRLHQTMREHAPRTPKVLQRFGDISTHIAVRLEKALTEHGVDDPAGRARLAFSTVDAAVHGLLAEPADTAVRDRRIALVVEQIVTVLTR